MPATLYLVATPIGNLEDITLRALRILRDEVEIIACEDTRQTLKLLDHFQIRKRLVSYHDHNEASRSAELLDAFGRGASVALVSDAGTPLISDPGYRIVHSAVEIGVPVVPIPGCSAALTALVASGLPANEFRFIGFVPPKSGARRRLLETLQTEPSTVIAYESPHRILDFLSDAAEVLPNRPLVLGRELTKLHEEFLRGTASVLHSQLAARPSIKGEFTVVLGGLGSSRNSDIDPLDVDARTKDPRAEVERLQADENLDRMEAIKAVAKQLGLPKREVYRLSAGQPASEPGSNPPGKRRG